MGRPLRPPAPEPIATGLWGVRYSTPQPLAAGDRMRGTPCLVCGEAIGGQLAITVGITYYLPDTSRAGHLPSSAWLAHAHHRGLTPRKIHDLAEWRLGINRPEEDTNR
jgi:hypothetical protein